MFELYIPVRPSVPKMEGIYVRHCGHPFWGCACGDFSLCALYWLACQLTVGSSGLCRCVYVMFFEHSMTPFWLILHRHSGPCSVSDWNPPKGVENVINQCLQFVFFFRLWPSVNILTITVISFSGSARRVGGGGGRWWKWGVLTVAMVTPLEGRCQGRETVLLLGGVCAVSDCGQWAGGKCVVSVVSGQRKHWYLRCDCFCSQCGSRNTGTYVVVVSVVSAAAETLVLQAMGVSVVSAAAETLVLQAVGETHIVSAAEETLLQAVGLLVPLPWLWSEVYVLCWAVFSVRHPAARAGPRHRVLARALAPWPPRLHPGA